MSTPRNSSPGSSWNAGRERDSEDPGPDSGSGSPSPRRRLAVFANSAAGRAQLALDSALAVFDEHDVVYRCHRPTTVEALHRAIHSAADEMDAAVIAGGDGTINRALPALVEAGLPLGLLPLGTANDLARTLGIPGNPADAARVVIEGICRRVDLGRANDRLFCNVAHIGFGVRAHSEGLDTRSKQRWRALSYPVCLLRSTVRLKPFRVDVTVDGNRERLRALHFSVGNGLFYGGGVPVHANATIDDGRLDVFAVPPQGWAGLARALWDVWHGGMPGSPVWRSAGREVTVRTRRPRRIMADGEHIARTPAEFTVLPGALLGIVPADGAGPGIRQENRR